MRFWQKYQYREYLFGVQSVLFAVSDTYTELFQDIGTETDIFMLESVKKDLNTEEGSYAIDELPFSVSHLACQSEDDFKAMYFVLDSANIKVNRYCALFFGETASLSDMLFIGKIGNKISGDDKFWEGQEYEFIVNPKREYKLSAYSFDISILDQVKLTGNIKDMSGTPVPNIYERFEAENWASIKNIFNYRLAYSTSSVVTPYAYFCHLGNLYKVIDLYLDKASEIIAQLTNTSMTLNLVEKSLGIQSSPVSFELEEEYNIDVTEVKTEQTVRIELKLSNSDSGTGWSAPFIHRKMIDPALGNTQEEDWQKNQVSSEKSYSFKNIDNVSDLLFEIARSFACYLFISYTSGTSINIEFKSRKGLVEEEYTYLIGAEEAGFDTSSVITKESNEFYGLGNNFAVDEFDEIINKANTDEPLPSKKFQDADQERKYAKEKKGIESERLLLTTSVITHTLDAVNSYGGHAFKTAPMNITQNNASWDTYGLYSLANAPGNGNSTATERLHTGIYLKTTPIKANQISRLGTTPVWRPASKVFTKINDSDMDFDSMTKYVNYILSRDKQYYETEYSLTVPFWNGFSKNADGSDPSWNNIFLGSKIKLAETVKRYDGNWIEEQVVRDYVVVGIEINLQKPETKLKLHSLERFAFGWWDGDEGQLPLFMFTSNQFGFLADDSVVVESYDVEDNEEILAGDAVMLLDNGKLAKSLSYSEYQNKTIGIAKENGTAGDKIIVQISGRVYFEGYSFTNISGQVFARTNLTETNITEEILDSPTANEDMIICLGRIDSEKSFILDINEFPFESGLVQA